MTIKCAAAILGFPAILVAAACCAAAEGPAPSPAPAPTVEQLRRTVEALEARLRDQDRRIAELESRQAKPDYGAELKKMVEEVLKEGDPMDLRLSWKDGLRLDSRDGNVKVQIGGRLFYDFFWGGGKEVEKIPAIGRLADGSEARSARLWVQGELWKNIAFKWEYDFATGAAQLNDAYLELRDLPVVGNLRAGHFKEPLSLSELTSARYRLFMEQSLASVFVPSYNAGFMLYRPVLGERVTLAGGLFRDADNQGFSSGDGRYIFTARATACPVYTRDGARVVHVGAAYSFREVDGTVRFRQRPEAHLGPYVADTGTFAADHVQLAAGELAVIVGPFHAEAEYIAAFANRPGADRATFGGWYVQGGYFLTGEVRPYKKASGVFDRVRPKKPYRQDGGYGAFEVAARYSELDLDDEGLEGGTVRDIALGLNWYLNNNVRLMWNYVHSDVDRGAAGEGGADILMTRLQFDF